MPLGDVSVFAAGWHVELPVADVLTPFMEALAFAYADAVATDEYLTR